MLQDERDGCRVDEGSEVDQLWELTRGGFLRRSALGALSLSGVAGLLSACGSDSGGSSGGKAAASKLVPDISVPYDPKAPAGTKPSLPGNFRYVRFSSDPFWVSYTQATSTGAKDAGLKFGDTNAQGDAAKYLDLCRQQLTAGTAGTTIIAIDKGAQQPLIQDAIDKGVLVITWGGMAPAVIYVFSPWPDLGKNMAEATSKYIDEKLGGRAQILLLNEDYQPNVKALWNAFRATMKAKGKGDQIVKDLTVQNIVDDGFKQTSSVLAAHPDVNVIIGPSLATTGAFSALESTKKARPEMYLASAGGTEGELAAIKKPNSAYKVSWAEPWLLHGYMSAQWTAAWLDGKAVPMGVYNKVKPVDASNIEQYEKDMADPGAVYKQNRLGEYMELYGSINYDTKSAHLKKDWSGPRA